IDSLDGIGRHLADANSVVEHELGELLTIDEDDAFLDEIDVFASIRREIRRGNEDAFSGALSFEASGESLDLRPTNHIPPTLGLNVHEAESEPVFLNNSVDPAVSALANGLTRILMRPAVSHRDKQVNDELFEEFGWRRLDT